MEDQNPSTLIKAIEKAAEGLRSTAAGLEEAAKQMGEMQNAVSPNAVKQLDRIQQKMSLLVQDGLPEKLEAVDKLLKIVPADLSDQLARFNLSFNDIRAKLIKTLKHLYVAPLILFQAEY